MFKYFKNIYIYIFFLEKIKPLILFFYIIYIAYFLCFVIKNQRFHYFYFKTFFKKKMLVLNFINIIDLNISFQIDCFFYNLYNNVTQILVVTNIMYFLGIFGIIYNKRNFLLTMLFVEVTYIGIFGYILGTSILHNLPVGQIYALSLLIIAACESAIGLGILLILFRNDNTINFENFTELRG